MRKSEKLTVIILTFWLLGWWRQRTRRNPKKVSVWNNLSAWTTRLTSVKTTLYL